jgi:hypothetical protein
MEKSFTAKDAKGREGNVGLMSSNDSSEADEQREGGSSYYLDLAFLRVLYGFKI